MASGTRPAAADAAPVGTDAASAAADEPVRCVAHLPPAPRRLVPAGSGSSSAPSCSASCSTALPGSPALPAGGGGSGRAGRRPTPRPTPPAGAAGPGRCSTPPTAGTTSGCPHRRSQTSNPDRARLAGATSAWLCWPVPSTVTATRSSPAWSPGLSPPPTVPRDLPRGAGAGPRPAAGLVTRLPEGQVDADSTVVVGGLPGADPPGRSVRPGADLPDGARAGDPGPGPRVVPHRWAHAVAAGRWHRVAGDPAGHRAGRRRRPR